jgi:hypothetical protein
MILSIEFGADYVLSYSIGQQGQQGQNGLGTIQ